MKVYLVQAASDVTGSAGYGKALLDCDFPTILVSFADATYRRRQTLFPDDDAKIWESQYDPVEKLARQKPSTPVRIGLHIHPDENPPEAVPSGSRRKLL